MKGNFRKSMALLLATSMALSSVPLGDLIVFAEENVTEAVTEVATDTEVPTSEPSQEISVESELTIPEPETNPNEGLPDETDDSEKNNVPPPNESLDETQEAETETPETVNDTSANDETETEVKTDSDNLTEEIKQTGTLLISTNAGGKIIIRDSQDNVLQELTATDVLSRPYELTEEIGTEVTIEMVSESEQYHVSEYRLMTDKGKTIQERQYESGSTKEIEHFVIMSEIESLQISFATADEEDYFLTAVNGNTKLTISRKDGKPFPENAQLRLLTVSDVEKSMVGETFSGNECKKKMQNVWEKVLKAECRECYPEHYSNVDQEDILNHPDENIWDNIEMFLPYYVSIMDASGEELPETDLKLTFSIDDREAFSRAAERIDRCRIGRHKDMKEWELDEKLGNLQVELLDNSILSYNVEASSGGWYSLLQVNPDWMLETEEVQTELPEQESETKDLTAEQETEEIPLDEDPMEVSETQVLSADTKSVPDKVEIHDGDPAWAPEELRSGRASTHKRKVTYNTPEGTVTRFAYCLEPLKGNPGENIYDLSDAVELNSGTKNMKLARCLFFLYGGPGWNMTVNGVNLKDILTNAGCSSENNYYAMTHYVLGYIYNDGNEELWNAHPAEKGVLNSAGVKLVIQLVNYISNFPNPYVNLSKTSLTTSFDPEKNVNISESVTYQTFKENTTTLSLPADITLVNETKGTSGTGKVTIEGGDTFHLEAAPTVNGPKSYTLKCSCATDFTAFKKSFTGDAQDLGFSYYTSEKTLTFSIDWPTTGSVKIKKRSYNPEITNGNSMYSLAGAQFAMKDASGAIKYTLTTDANGDSDTIEVLNGKYEIEEITVPKGYKKAPNTPVTVAPGQTNVIDIKDEPIYGETDVTIRKEAAGATNKSMAGAQFKVEYFDNTGCTGTPLRTWVFKSEDNTDPESGNIYGFSKFDSSHRISGDTLYANNALPLGSIRVTEVKAPTGFDIDPNAVKTGTIIQNGNSASVTFDGKYNAPFSLTDKSFFGGVKINKDCIDRGSKPSGDATLEGAVFAVYNNNDYTVYRPDAPDKAIAKGEEICRMTTNADGDAQSPKVFTNGTFFNVLQCDGNYVIREINPSTGYLLPDGFQKEFYLPDTADKIVDLTGEPVIEPVIKGGIRITKQDSELKRNAAPQGDASLQGAEFTVTNKSVNPVVVNGQEYAAGEVVMTLTTDKDGCAETGEKTLPYGTYEVRETRTPEGYLLNGYVDTIQIRTDGEYPYAKSFQTVPEEAGQYWYEDVVRFDIELTKFKDTLTSEDPDDRVECIPGIDFSIRNVSGHSVLVGGKEYQPGEVVMTITTDENGVATTKQDGAVRGALPYGHYLIHEVNCPEELVPVKDFTVDGTAAGGVYDGKTYKGIYLNNVPVESRIRIRKVDVETNKTIPQGATFQILDKDKNVMRFRVTYPVTKYITEFTTNEDGIIETPTKLPYGTYYLHEIDPPYDRENLENGYVLDEDMEFTVSENNAWEDAIEVTYEDFPTKGILKVTKADADTGQAVAGAVYAVFADADIVTGDGTVHYRKGEIADTVTIGEDGEGTTEELYLGAYHLQEIKAPRGYCLDESVYPFVLKYDPEQKDAFVLVNVREETLLNKPTTLKLYKDDIDGLALDGITFRLERVKDIQDSGIPNSHAVDGGTYVTSSGGRIEVKYLVSGVYSLTEAETLPGYVLDSTPRYVTVDENGCIFASDADGNSLDADGAKSDTVSLDWENDYTKWDFSKTDVTGGAELEGAELEIHDSDGKMVCHWTSGREAHRINKIPLGKYTLVEKTAPKGYVIAREVPFEVTNTGAVQKAAMADKTVTAHKVDETGNGAAGAKLEVYLAGGTEGNPGRMVDSWTADGKPHDICGLEEGLDYVLVEAEAPEGWVKANPVPFSVTYEKENQDITMVDIRVKAHKYDETAEVYVEGAKLEVQDADGTVIDSWTTGKEAHYISGLTAGKSYILYETEAPDGFAKALPVKFTAEDNGKDQEVAMVNKRVIVSKVDTSVKELAGAKLHVEDEQGNTIDSWVSDGKPHDIKGLEVGKTYTLAEDEAPEGYAVASPIVFTVADNAKNDEFSLVNKQVFIHKVDVTGEKEIQGAKIKVLDLQGNMVDKWTSEEEAHPVSNIRVNETYILHEETAPKGFVVASDIEFTVYDDFKVQHVSMKDKQVWMSKTDVTGEKEIPGAEIKVLDLQGNVVDEWTSEEESHPISNLKVGETYVLHEEAAPEGFVVASDIEFTVYDDFKVQHVSMKDKQVWMSKTDVTGEKEVPGAEIVVYDKDGKEADRWISGETPHPISNLKVGETYTLHEEVAADGYVTASDIVFTAEDDYADQKVSMTDKQVFVSKKSVTGSEELTGAKLTVTESGTGKVVDTWVSGGTPHAVNGLTVGGHYILTEETAPEGYVIAEAVAFEVPEDGKIQTVEMKDKQVSMSKVDVSGREVPGATITVTDGNGKIVDKWESKETPHNISGLEVGKTYTLTETQAPDGYVIAESIPFTVENDFTVQHVEMVDKQVLVSKTDITGSGEIEGAHLSVTDEDGNTVDEWDSTTDGPHPVSGLEVGKTYTLTETQAPDGYVTAESITFAVEDNFQIQTVEMRDDHTKVEVSKQDITTKKELPGAKLEIRNEDGDVVEAWTSTDKPHYIEKLPVGEYTLTEVTAPDGYEVAETVRFTVEDTGEIQHATMFDSPKPASGTPTPKTGDTFPVKEAAATAGLVVLLFEIGFMLLRRKKGLDNKRR